MAPRSLGHRAPLLWLVLPYAAGLAAGRLLGGVAVVPCLIAATVAGGLALLCAGRHFKLWAGALLVACGLAGAASYTLHRARLPAWEQLPPREAELGLRVEHTFAAKFPNRTTGLAVVIRTDPHLRDLLGQKIYYSLRLASNEPVPLATAEIETIGVLELLVENPPHDSFEGYLAAAGMNFTLSRGQVRQVTKPPTAFRQFCSRMADRFADLLSRGVAAKQPELTGVLRAMLLGQKDELSPEQDRLFLQSGTMHLFAISGLHIGVIALGLHALVALLRFPRLIKLGLSLTLLWLYVQITGGSPSAVRAFCMVALIQVSLQWRVPGNPLAALAAAALLVLLIDPLQLFSASFQLSYGIVSALLLMGLPLGEAWQERWPLFAQLPKATWRWRHHRIEQVWRGMLGALAIGFASILFSMIAGVDYFGLFTPGALIANLALIPIASFVILAGMGSLLCGLVGFTWGGVLCNHAAVLTLWAMDEAIRVFVDVPGVYQAASFQAPWIGPAALTLLTGSLLWGYAQRWTPARGGWWPPVAIVALTLIFGVNFT
jgi:competence protein ComEC